MQKRWYDANPTVSMAVSLLQNALPHHRKKTISHIQEKLNMDYPWLNEELPPEPKGFWPLIQKRQTMNEDAWATVESLRFLPEADREKLAIEIISFIYCLENEMPETEKAWNSLSTFEMVV